MEDSNEGQGCGKFSWIREFILMFIQNFSYIAKLLNELKDKKE